ncbi:MAG: hypothetical protein IPN33_03125 [Saprospiraceae bacterium]|nr:hypothetical protein [Saprospiraceae bacterium]
MVWVGVNFLIEGVLQYFKYEESDIPTADDNFIKIIVAIVSFGLAYFIIALIGGNYDGLFTEMMKNF